jgi:hypothetical protein
MTNYKIGEAVIWENDVYKIEIIGGDILTISNGYSEAEVFAHEIKPLKPKIENISDLIEAIQNEVEFLQTTEFDEIECIGIENLEGILSRYFNTTIKLTQ